MDLVGSAVLQLLPVVVLSSGHERHQFTRMEQVQHPAAANL